MFLLFHFGQTYSCLVVSFLTYWISNFWNGIIKITAKNHQQQQQQSLNQLWPWDLNSVKAWSHSSCDSNVSFLRPRNSRAFPASNLSCKTKRRLLMTKRRSDAANGSALRYNVKHDDYLQCLIKFCHRLNQRSRLELAQWEGVIRSKHHFILRKSAGQAPPPHAVPSQCRWLTFPMTSVSNLRETGSWTRESV